MDREELIERARLAFVEAWEAERKRIGRGIAEPGTKSRAGIRAALAVFEQAHTPTEDYPDAEGLATLRAATPSDTTIPRYAMLDVWMALYGHETSQAFDSFHESAGYAEAWATLLAAIRARAGEQRGEPTPINGKWVCGKCARAAALGQDDGQIPGHHRTCPNRGHAAQDEPPTVQLMARKGGRTQALIDQMLAQANERGIRVEVVSPQDEPTDATADAVARAIVDHDEDRMTCYDHDRFCCPCGELHDASRAEWRRHQARAALRAAREEDR